MTSSDKLSRPWDAFDGYLFDIDGTLLNCADAVHYFAFCNALTEVAGRPLTLEGIVTHGNTDGGILRDAWGLAGVAETVWRPRMDAVRAAMGAEVERNRGDLRIEVLPGVPDLLAHLRRKGAVLSTATGNFARIGRTKLQACGLAEYFQLGGWSDGYESRAEVFAAALGVLRRRLGPGAAVCVFGDTPADVQAAHANHLEVVAVATGIFTRGELAIEGPELLVDSLGELLPRRGAGVEEVSIETPRTPLGTQA